MNFDSSVFLFLALPIILLINSILRNKARNIFLFIINILVYAFGEPIFIIVLLCTMAINFGFGYLCKNFQTKKPLFTKIIFIVCVCINLGSLIFFKYIAFLGETLNSLLGWFSIAPLNVLKVALPIGISFYTFQAVSYIADVYTKKCSPATNFIKFGVYYSCFAQITAGPIVRYKDISAELDNRVITLDSFASGLKRFLIGLGQKIFLANYFAKIVNEIFATQASAIGGATAWIGIIFYALQIFFDFAGYSSMAIGMAKMLGFNYKENFNHPYTANSISDFWRRWHISLSTWFRDYIYFPLGGNKKGKFRMYLGLFLVFVLSGIWHGANSTFFVWGLYHAIFIMLEKTPFVKRVINKSPKPIIHIYSLLVVVIGWVFFRAPSLSYAFDYLLSMLFINGFANALPSFSLAMMLIFVAGVIGCMPVFAKLKQIIENSNNQKLILAMDILSWVALIVIFVVCIPIILSGSTTPFIYAQF